MKTGTLQWGFYLWELTSREFPVSLTEFGFAVHLIDKHFVCFFHTLISLINVTSRYPILKNSTLNKKNPPLHVYWFLRSFPSSTLRLLHLCTSFFQKIPSSTFIPTFTVIREMRVGTPAIKSIVRLSFTYLLQNLHSKANACNIGTCFRSYMQMRVEKTPELLQIEFIFSSHNSVAVRFKFQCY